jgi:hypothetical protein
MTHARPFWTFTLQELSNDIKNTSRRGVLTPIIELWVFGSPGGLSSPIFGSVSGDLTLPSKWGCDIPSHCTANPLARGPLPSWPSSTQFCNHFERGLSGSWHTNSWWRVVWTGAGQRFLAPNGARTQIQVSSTDTSATRPLVQMQADLGLYCVVFCVTPSCVGYATNTSKGCNVMCFVMFLAKLLSFGKTYLSYKLNFYLLVKPIFFLG